MANPASVDHAPVAVADGGLGFSTTSRYRYTTASVLANDSDPDGDHLTITSVDTTNLLGTLVNNGDGTFGYNSGSAFDALPFFSSGTTSFSYTVSDGTLTSTAAVTLTVQHVYDIGPTVGNDTAATAYETPVVIAVNANDDDPDGYLLFNKFYANHYPLHGSVTFNADHTVTYTPVAGFSGVDGFDYAAYDNQQIYGVGHVTVTVGPPPGGAQFLTLRVSEDAYQGDAQFIVLVDGQQVGGVQTATASHAAGSYQDVTVQGGFSLTPTSVVVQFINDLYGGDAAHDRNLYVDKLTLNGQTFQGEAAFNTAGYNTATEAVLLGTGPHADGSLMFDASPSVVVRVSEDAYQGDAQMAVYVNGLFVGLDTVTASHAAGAYQEFTFHGLYGIVNNSPQSVAVEFRNDLYGGSPEADRNLYVDKVTVNGHIFEAETGVNTAGYNSGTEAVLLGPGPSGSGRLVLNTAPDTFVVRVSEDAYLGDAQFVLKVDGQQVGEVQTVTARHATGNAQDITLTGVLGSGPHDVAIQFVNDLYGGDAAHDRNLYVDKLTINGHVFEGEGGVNTAGYNAGSEAALLGSAGSLSIHYDLSA